MEIISRLCRDQMQRCTLTEPATCEAEAQDFRVHLGNIARLHLKINFKNIVRNNLEVEIIL